MEILLVITINAKSWESQYLLNDEYLNNHYWPKGEKILWFYKKMSLPKNVLIMLLCCSSWVLNISIHTRKIYKLMKMTKK